MQISFVARSWSMLVIAILSWCGVTFFIIALLQMQSERQKYAADAAVANLQQGQVAQLRVLARETETDRNVIENNASTDVLSAVNLIESISASGTPVHITSAQAVKVSAKGNQ